MSNSETFTLTFVIIKQNKINAYRKVSSGLLNLVLTRNMQLLTCTTCTQHTDKRVFDM